MIRKLLLALGLRKAPLSVRNYLAISSLVGSLPALAYLAWKNRAKIGPRLHRATRAGATA